MAAETDQDGLTVVLSRAQLAAVLSGAHISEHEMLVNRLSGGVRLAGGVLEAAVGAGLEGAPDPTTLTKFAGWALLVHASDVSAAAAQQMWTGRETRDWTQWTSETVARGVGAGPSAARGFGDGLDIAVPLFLAIGVPRVAAVRSGRIVIESFDLADHEGPPGQGGHTLAKHVGQTDVQLRARLVAEPGAPAASSFFSKDIAEEAISEALRSDRSEISSWIAQPAGRFKHVIESFECGKTIGIGVSRSMEGTVRLSAVRVVLVRGAQAGRDYYVLTAYPVR